MFAIFIKFGQPVWGVALSPDLVVTFIACQQSVVQELNAEKEGGVVADAIHSLHTFGYAHLDIRLKNICFSTASPHHAILIDLDRCSPVTKPAYFQERYYPSSTTYKSCDKGGGKVIEKPQIINDYNCFMGGVNVVDQHLVYYAIGRKGLKWWRRVFYCLLERAIVNSYDCYIQVEWS